MQLRVRALSKGESFRFLNPLTLSLYYSGENGMKTKVLLADDHLLMRQGLKSLIERQADMVVIGEAENGYVAVRMATELHPDIVVMDIGMPELNGIDASHQILAGHPEIKIIGLSMHADQRYIMEMLKVGAAGYLLKDCAFEELALAIRAVKSNQIYLSPKIEHLILKDYVHRLKQNGNSVYTILTTREREVLQMLAEGKTTKQIATSLKVSIKTIETYRQQMMEKLNMFTVADLTKYAIREGLASLEITKH
jgi:DNA-binding NarL/FixJ family response regulator